MYMLITFAPAEDQTHDFSNAKPTFYLAAIKASLYAVQVFCIANTTTYSSS